MEQSQSPRAIDGDFAAFQDIPVVSFGDDEDGENGRSQDLPKVKAMGTLPTERRINDIFLRIVRQLDYLYRTADMMNTRLDDLQNEIDDLVQKNVE